MLLRSFTLLAGLLFSALSHAQVSDPVIITGAPYAVPAPAPVLAPRANVDDAEIGADELADIRLGLSSASALVIDQEDGRLLYAKNTGVVMPIASITKLMTAIVVLDSGAPLDDTIAVSGEDVDRLKGSTSRLRPGVALSRREMLRLALMASENRAASALARHYPGGTQAFVDAMNQKARQLGMRDTHFVDPTGLNPNNVSTAMDLAKMVNAGYGYNLIRDFTTTPSVELAFPYARRIRPVAFRNSNALVRSGEWDIGLSKTGYISEAGRCLVMQARIAAKPVIIVLLDSFGKLTRIADANRIKRWMETIDLRAVSGRPRIM